MPIRCLKHMNLCSSDESPAGKVCETWAPVAIALGVFNTLGCY